MLAGASCIPPFLLSPLFPVLPPILPPPPSHTHTHMHIHMHTHTHTHTHTHACLSFLPHPLALLKFSPMKLFILFNGHFPYRIIGYKLSLFPPRGESQREEKRKTAMRSGSGGSVACQRPAGGVRRGEGLVCQRQPHTCRDVRTNKAG